MREHWHLAPDLTYLNHGTVGATPKQVLAAQQRYQLQAEQDPAGFCIRSLQATLAYNEGEPTLRCAARQMAEFVGVGEDADGFAFVANVTTGIGSVLRSLELRANDEILVTSLGYGAITYGAEYVASRVGANVVVCPLPFPAISQRWRAEVVAAIAERCSERTRLVLIDHIAADSAMMLPVAEIAQAVRTPRRHILVDGAHAPGAIALNIAALGVDYYAANLHKWAMCPRSSGMLWVAAQHRPTIQPAVISWGMKGSFTDRFDWVGTYDPSPFLASKDALEFMNWVGVERMQQYNHALANEAQALLAKRWGFSPVADEHFGTMVTVPLPVPIGREQTPAAARALRDALRFRHRIEAHVLSIHDRLWVRIACQVYNHIGEIERLAQAIEVEFSGS